MNFKMLAIGAEKLIVGVFRIEFYMRTKPALCSTWNKKDIWA